MAISCGTKQIMFEIIYLQFCFFTCEENPVVYLFESAKCLQIGHSLLHFFFCITHMFVVFCKVSHARILSINRMRDGTLKHIGVRLKIQYISWNFNQIYILYHALLGAYKQIARDDQGCLPKSNIKFVKTEFFLEYQWPGIIR